MDSEYLRARRRAHAGAGLRARVRRYTMEVVVEHDHAIPPLRTHVSLSLADLRMALYASYRQLDALDPTSGLPMSVEGDLRQLAARLDQVLHQVHPERGS